MNVITASDSIKYARELSVVIPTYNESENLPILLGKLKEVLNGIDYEIVVVDDDSPDQTWKIAQQLSNENERIRVIRRQDARGLSSAVVTGMASSNGKVISVMDADMQHDETILPDMYRAIAEGRCDICIGSREAPGGGYGDWSKSRRFVSYTAKALAYLALSTPIKDPMSGYFALSREYFDRTIDRVNPSGFKILLEFVTRGDNPRVEEIGYRFRNRIYGETKLNATVAVEYLLALIDLRFGWLIPNRFVKFGMVGVSGSIVNFLGFAIASGLGVSVPLAVFIGVQSAIMWTYFGNNLFTFSPIRYRGMSYLRGLVLYEFASIYGLVIQLSVVTTIITYWPTVNDYLGLKYMAYMVGVAFAALGNYFIHTNYTWNRLGYKLAMPVRS
ncbi:MAG TPA: glycosyltransferase [Gammaproteobacteria bacterium]|nr:glycosyltransferase [Gammaproteobacteria bacterium]